MRVLRIARLADEDMTSLLARSNEEFGAAARRRYEALLSAAFTSLCANPEMFGSVARPELGDGVRTYHLRYSRAQARTGGRAVRQPRHLIVYRPMGNRELQVIRVLHDSMEVQRHLPAISTEGKPEKT